MMANMRVDEAGTFALLHPGVVSRQVFELVTYEMLVDIQQSWAQQSPYDQPIECPEAVFSADTPRTWDAFPLLGIQLAILRTAIVKHWYDWAVLLLGEETWMPSVSEYGQAEELIEQMLAHGATLCLNGRFVANNAPAVINTIAGYCQRLLAPQAVAYMAAVRGAVGFQPPQATSRRSA